MAAVLQDYRPALLGGLSILPDLDDDAVQSLRRELGVPDTEIVIGAVGIEGVADGTAALVAFGLRSVYLRLPKGDLSEVSFSTFGSLPFSTFGSLVGDTPAAADGSALLAGLVIAMSRSSIQTYHPSSHVVVLELLQRIEELARAHQEQLAQAENLLTTSSDQLVLARSAVVERVSADSAARADELVKWVGDLIKTLGRHVGRIGSKMFIGPQITEKKLRNVYERYGVPASEQPIGLIETTLLGSAKEGLLFGVRGVYWRNSGQQGAYDLAYEAFPSHEFRVSTKDKHSLKLGEHWFRTGGVCTAERALSLFVDVRALIEDSLYDDDLDQLSSKQLNARIDQINEGLAPADRLAKGGTKADRVRRIRKGSTG